MKHELRAMHSQRNGSIVNITQALAARRFTRPANTPWKA
jgi:hypothetical protein